MRSRILLTTLPLLCISAMLVACSSPPVRQDTTRSVVAADENYVRGRNLHLARRYDEAVVAYQAALKAEPGHVNARNGLAIAYAEQRDFARAIPIWRELTRGATIGSGPATGFLFSNLGYAYFLSGKYDDALVALEKSCLLDPLNHYSWQRLGETLLQLGQQERAQQMLRQASALREHDVRADVAVAGGTRVAAIEQAVKTVRQPERDWAFVEVVTKANGMLELRRVVPAAVPAVATHGEPVPFKPDNNKTLPLVVAIEISNGHGRQGLARLLSRQIRDPNLKVVRLTNEKNYGVRQTRIEYQSAYRSAAERLAQQFGASKPVEVSMAGRANVRLVIGRDLPSGLLANRSASLATTRTSASGAP